MLRLALSLAITIVIATAIAIALAREIRRQRAHFANRDIPEDEFFDLSRYDSDTNIPILATVLAIATALALATVIGTNSRRANRDVLYSTTALTTATDFDSRRANCDLFNYEYDLFEYEDNNNDNEFLDLSRAASDYDSDYNSDYDPLRLPIRTADLGPSQLQGQESLLTVVGNLREELGNGRIRSKYI